MNRRKFLKWLGVGTAVAAVAPYADTVMGPACVAPTTTAYSTYIMGKDAVIGGYADYANFSELAIDAAVEQSVRDTAYQLMCRAGLGISQLSSCV